MLVQVTEKNVYGTMKLYPYNRQAQIFTSLLGRVTLTNKDIHYIKLLGYKVEVVMNLGFYTKLL